MSLHQTTIGLQDMVTIITRMMLPRGASAMFLGSVGIGKTSCIRHEIRRLQRTTQNFGGISYNAGASQSIDWTGFPSPSDSPLSMLGAPTWSQPDPLLGMRGAYPAIVPPELRELDPDAKGKPKTWTHPTFSAEEVRREHLKAFSMGIANIDEPTSVGDDTVYQPLRQFMLEKKVGPWTLAEGWCTIGTGNGSDDMAGARDMPTNMRTALSVWRVKPIAADCEIIWQSLGMHKDFIDFGMAHAGEVINAALPTDQSQFSTVRSWTEAWLDCMAYCYYAMGVPGAKPIHKGPRAPQSEHFPLPRSKPVDPGARRMSRSEELIASLTTPEDAPAVLDNPHHIAMFYRAVAARVGPSVALQFQQFIQDNTDRPTLEQVLDNPHAAKQPGNPAVLQSMTRMFIEHFHMDHLRPLSIYMINKWPRPIVASFVTKLAAKHTVSIAQSSDFIAMMDYGGAGARIGVLGKV